MFPPLAVSQRNKSRVEGRKKPSKKQGILKGPDQEQAQPFSLQCPPALKAQPAVSRSECEALVDGYNHPLEALAVCSLPLPVWATGAIIISETWLGGLLEMSLC